LITATIGTLLVIPVLSRVFETPQPQPLPARREGVEEEAVA
jgi:hypothetical protein